MEMTKSSPREVHVLISVERNSQNKQKKRSKKQFLGLKIKISETEH